MYKNYPRQVHNKTKLKIIITKQAHTFKPYCIHT